MNHRLLIDRQAAEGAALITSTTEYGPTRRYYELGGALIVCHNSLELRQLIGYVVDAQSGQDIARPGFTLDESSIGQRRPKITIRRVTWRGSRLTLTRLIESAR